VPFRSLRSMPVALLLGLAACSGNAGAPQSDGRTTDTILDTAADTINFEPPDGRSCAGGLTCNGESCCTSIAVPGGTFPMGRGTEDCGEAGCLAGEGNEGCPNGHGMYCDEDELPEHPVTVADFSLDKYEVTVGRFRSFVNAYVDSTVSAPAPGAGAHALIPGSGWDGDWNAYLPPDREMFKRRLKCGASDPFTLDTGGPTWTDAPGGNETLAINCVSWYEAMAFCIWDGGTLPTEAEWEYAAAGGDENRLYPWGNREPDCTVANFYNFPDASWGARCFEGEEVGGGAPWPVGNVSPEGDGRWGHADMDGNVFEWALDWYGEYSSLQSDNFANVAGGTCRVVRGGFFYVDYATGQRAAGRHARDTVPGIHDISIGFRCARSAP
jgi:sulfatase modifying factor 1